MIGSNKAAGDYHSVLDPARARRRMLMRAALAAAVVLVLMLSLVFVDDQPSQQTVAESGPRAQLVLPPLQTSAVPTLNARSLPEPASVAPRLPDLPVVPTPAERVVPGEVSSAAAEGAGDLVEPAPVEAHDAPERAVVPESSPDAVVTVEADQPLAATVPAPVASPPVASAAPPARAVAAPRTGTAGAGRFVVQVGEYTLLPRAESTAATLRAEGLDGTLQRRVVVGPYPDRKRAEEAIAVLKRERNLSGFIVSEPGGRAVMVQLGVFSDPANAESLQQQLVAAGFKAHVHGRPVLGPYDGRSEAERALVKVRTERKIDGTIVAVR